KAVCIEIDVDELISVSNDNIEFIEPSTQQSTYYDLSLDISNGAKFSELEKCWNALELEELTSVKVIDTFEKDGVKSIAIRLIFSSKERTLEMEEVQGWIDSILENLSKINVSLKK
ncbi:MAG: phenylalanine--tRNA ligase subunit beta, partial [Clostridia bacterium]|nr:phenylalanine--tRNA ligase subunit beta [Clostridia bacterium]